ncbi:LOW QUALITY PROTEIN: hypothetical protein V2J09_012005 [Rumex salicifolius]
MAAESLRIGGGGASTMPVCTFRNGTLLSPPSRRRTISASAFLRRHSSSPSSSMCSAFFVSLCISSFTPSVFPAVPRHNLRGRNLSVQAMAGEGTIMTISKDRVVPFPTPDSSKLNEIFATGVVLGAYQAVMTVVAIKSTDFFSVNQPSFLQSYLYNYKVNSYVKEVTRLLVSLASRKRYLQEPAVSALLSLADVNLNKEPYLPLEYKEHGYSCCSDSHEATQTEHDFVTENDLDHLLHLLN